MAEGQTGVFGKTGYPPGRVIFDPGIGFGKTPGQCLQILNRIEEFFDFDVRVLVGASRKSFIKSFTCSTGQVQPTREEGSALGEQSGQKPPPALQASRGKGGFSTSGILRAWEYPCLWPCGGWT